MSQVAEVFCLRENQHYTVDSLAVLLAPINEEEVKAFIAYMRDQEVCKTDRERGTVTFQYVGLLEFRCEKGPDGLRRKLVFFEPKFFPERSNYECKTDGFTVAQKIVLKAIFKYQKAQQISLFSNGRIVSYEGCSHRLSTQLALILDVMEKGVYQVPKIEHVLNGQGNIDWQETFVRVDPFFTDGGPCYVDTVTREMGYDDDTYISRLQMCLTSRCFAYFEEIGLASPLGLFLESPYDGDLDEFGSKNYRASRLMHELRTQFIDDKQQSLRLMQAVLEDDAYGSDSLDFQSFGISGFHALWERAIKDVFVDELELTPNQLGLFCESEDKANRPLKDFIDPPVWIMADSDIRASPRDGTATERLRPDFVAVGRDVSPEVGIKPTSLIILDAKYYLPEFEGTVLTGVPGVGDVDKQLLYEIGFSKLADENGVAKHVYNAFLFPTYKERVEEWITTEIAGEFFASINVGVFAELCSAITKADVRSTFDSYKIDGLALLSRYARNSTDDASRSNLMEILKKEHEKSMVTGKEVAQ